MIDSDIEHLIAWAEEVDINEAKIFGDMRSNEATLCQRALRELQFFQHEHDKLLDRCAKLVGHESEDPIEEILSTLETLFSK